MPSGVVARRRDGDDDALGVAGGIQRLEVGRRGGVGAVDERRPRRSREPDADVAGGRGGCGDGVDELDLVAGQGSAGHALDGVPGARPRPVDHDDDLEPVGR